MTTTTTTHLEASDLRFHGHRVTNLGPGVHADVGGCTTITMHFHGEEPVIEWINTYGNVHANTGQYELAGSGRQAAIAALEDAVRIVAERKARQQATR